MDSKFTSCEQCNMAAEVLDEFDLPSTDGPVHHIRTRCVQNHYITIIDEQRVID